jgi:uncharacterized protein Usg
VNGCQPLGIIEKFRSKLLPGETNNGEIPDDQLEERMRPADSQHSANEGFGLTTAQIVYRMPDHLELFQDFVWQRYDLFPHFPELKAFLKFWEEKIEGPIHSVTVAHALLVKPLDFRELRRPLH